MDDQEKTIQFLLEQQAKFFAGLEELKENQRSIQEQQRQFQIQMQQEHLKFQEEHSNMRQLHMGLQSQVNSLGLAMLGLTDHLKDVTVKLASLAEAQLHTEERLNALIVVVDGIVRRLDQPG
jgi:hypothetical protein